MSAGSVQRPQSAFLVVNRPSGNGRSPDDVGLLRSAFDGCFRWIGNRTFAVAEGHGEVVSLTREFLSAVKGPCFLLSGGGGGTNRALVQGLLEEVESGTVCLKDVLISSLRLGSGNLIPKYFDMPRDPLEGMRRISGDLDAGQAHACCVYRCTLHHPDAMIKQHYGLTMGGLGQFARVPDDIKRWRDLHSRLMRCASRVIPLEAINTFQYTAFSVLRAIRCVARPERAELVEIRHGRRSERFRLFAGILLNFDFPQLPIRMGCDIGETRLVLCCIPCEGRGSTLYSLLDWRRLNRHIREYEISPDAPIEIEFLDDNRTTLALDEDTFAAPARVGFEVAGLIQFVTGASASRQAQPDRQAIAVRRATYRQPRGVL